MRSEKRLQKGIQGESRGKVRLGEKNIPEMSEGIQVRSSTCCHEESP